MKVLSTATGPNFSQILEASLRELMEFQLAGQFHEPIHREYCDILKSYLQADAADLEKRLRNLPDGSDIKVTASLRLAVLKNAITESEILPALSVAKTESKFAGEASFALGWAYFRLQKNLEAQQMFRLAQEKFKSLGANKKSVRALLNVIVAESRIYPEKKLIREYELVAVQAALVGSHEVEGVCYQNICKELHGIGAFELALKYSNKALHLQDADSGTLHYYESILQRCHILIDLGRFHEARLDFEAAKVSTHTQIIEARKCIEKLLGADAKPKEDYLEPIWRERLEKGFPDKAKLSPMEMDFVSLIKSEKRRRDFLATQLYGGNIDFVSARNRFKVFLGRFKKKYPGMIAEENGEILLADEGHIRL